MSELKNILIGLIILIMGVIVAAIGAGLPEQSLAFYVVGGIMGIIGLVIIIPAAKKYAK